MMNIKEFAKLIGVSIRTLHYYDEIGLLKPDFVDRQNGYRQYGENAFCRMQEILFYRELDFPLKTIKEIISSESYDKKAALVGQKKLLLLKKQRLERIIAAIESAEKGEHIMDFKALEAEEIDTYKAEAKARWGNTEAYRESERKSDAGVAEGMNAIIAEFAAAKKAALRQSRRKALCKS